MSEKEFVEQIIKWRIKLFRKIYYMIHHKEAAQDLVQDTFFKAYKNLQRYDSSKNFSSWLFAIGIRLAIDYLRSPERRIDYVNGKMEQLAGPDEREHETYKIVRRAVCDLSEPYFTLVRLKYFEALSEKEVMVKTGSSLAQVKSRLFRARRRLAKRLKNEL
jgi:RNA polymerase sigma-70 factor (ECF subfamily)